MYNTQSNANAKANATSICQGFQYNLEPCCFRSGICAVVAHHQNENKKILVLFVTFVCAQLVLC